MIKTIEFRASIAPIMSGIRTGGDGLRLTLDIPESDVQDAVALIALRNCPLLVTIAVDNSPASTRITRPENGDKPKREKAKKEPKGPFSAYWQQMFKTGFNNFPALIQTLDCAGDQIRLRLHDLFKVDTLSDVAPAEFEQWMTSEGPELFASLITLSRQAQAALDEMK